MHLGKKDAYVSEAAWNHGKIDLRWILMVFWADKDRSHFNPPGENDRLIVHFNFAKKWLSEAKQKA